MARVFRVTVRIEDVNGSFARLIKQAPKEARAFLSQAVATTTVAVNQRMKARVPVDEGQLKAALDVRLPKGNRLHGQAGVWDPEQAAIAQFNEWTPNKQPFMRPSAQDESAEFKARAEKALKRMEAALSQGI